MYKMFVMESLGYDHLPKLHLFSDFNALCIFRLAFPSISRTHFFACCTLCLPTCHSSSSGSNYVKLSRAIQHKMCIDNKSPLVSQLEFMEAKPVRLFSTCWGRIVTSRLTRGLFLLV